jgi:hypothetical protein
VGGGGQTHLCPLGSVHGGVHLRARKLHLEHRHPLGLNVRRGARGAPRARGAGRRRRGRGQRVPGRRREAQPPWPRGRRRAVAARGGRFRGGPAGAGAGWAGLVGARRRWAPAGGDEWPGRAGRAVSVSGRGTGAAGCACALASRRACCRAGPARARSNGPEASRFLLRHGFQSLISAKLRGNL